MQLCKKYSGSQSSLSVSSRYLFKAPAGQVIFQTMNFKEPFWSTFNRRDPGWYCFTEWHLWVLAISKDGCGLAAMWGRTTCLFIKHWDSPFKSAEETRMKSLMPRSIVRGALLDDEIYQIAGFIFIFTTLEDSPTLKGLREGGWRGWNHLDVQHCRFESPSPRAQHTQCICLTSLLLPGFTLRIAQAPRAIENAPALTLGFS